MPYAFSVNFVLFITTSLHSITDDIPLCLSFFPLFRPVVLYFIEMWDGNLYRGCHILTDLDILTWSFHERFDIIHKNENIIFFNDSDRNRQYNITHIIYYRNDKFSLLIPSICCISNILIVS